MCFVNCLSQPAPARCGRVNVVPNHRWRLTRKAFLGGLRRPRPPQLVGRCRGLRRPGGPHGHRFGRPLSRPPKASVWGHVQDQPRSACLVRMIWVKDQHAQHWPWTLLNLREFVYYSRNPCPRRVGTAWESARLIAFPGLRRASRLRRCVPFWSF